ncbi:putative histidine phosphatase superfamily, clade-1 [Helianthus anomalus]
MAANSFKGSDRLFQRGQADSSECEIQGIALTQQGISHARLTGTQIHQVVSGSDSLPDTWKVYFYVSPYTRTRSSLQEIVRSFPRKCVIRVREKCRIREPDFGNFQITEEMKVIKDVRQRISCLIYDGSDTDTYGLNIWEITFKKVQAFLNLYGET